MFKFGFGGDQESAKPSEKTLDQDSKPSHKIAHFVDIIPTPPSDGEPVDLVQLCNGTIDLRKSVADVPSSLSADGADVVPGLYEGGYKLWEGAADLCGYIHTELGDTLRNRNVLELGAGHALPSVLALRAGARVTIHDFNEDVLRDVSAPNIALNASDRSTNVLFIAGDWKALPAHLSSFDVVLSAETTYYEPALNDLARCTLDVLADDGVALFAGKSYYFGVGGGMRTFRGVVEEVARERQDVLKIDVVQVLRDGKSNVREILSIRKQKADRV